MIVSTAGEPEQATPELEERFTHSGWYKRQCMIAELAMGGLSYRQIGQKCGKTANNVRQFAWYYKKEIAEERARSYAELRLRCNGEKQYRVKVLKEIIEEMNERLVEFAEACNRLDLRFLEDQAVWNNYHTASVVIENCKPTSSARSKRSWTLKPAVHVKKPKWMWTSYSTPAARDAKNRYLRWLPPDL